MKLAFILDQLDSIKTYKDSSFAMMREAAARDYQLFTLQQGDLAWKDARTVGFARALELAGKADDDAHRWYQTKEPEEIPLQEFDAVLMRRRDRCGTAATRRDREIAEALGPARTM